MKSVKNIKEEKRMSRRRRVRARVFGTSERPRLAVFKSNRFIYVQLVDDNAGKTLAAANTKEVKGKSMAEKVGALGKKIAETAKAKKIKKVVFDRGGYLYSGKIKALADSAREGGLVF